MIIHGDCLEEMRKMEANSVSCIVTDPPYGLHFMGKDWDSFKQKTSVGYNQPGMPRKSRVSETDGSYLAGTYDDRRNDEFQCFIEKFGVEALRIVKPGGYILMFGAPRRFHRQTCGLEDAGWEIRDCLMWIFGSGFPKSHNHFGIEGYGTALKPAYEPIIMAMKPCDGTFKQNAEKWGQAGINIDGSRIGTDDTHAPAGKNALGLMNDDGWKCKSMTVGSEKGRWPANILFDEEAAHQLDEQSGISKSIASDRGNKTQDGGYGKRWGRRPTFGHSDFGGASRFFYCAKASSSQRNEGLEDRVAEMTTDGCICSNPESAKKYQANSAPRKNPHPTVKPLKLMEYLIKLVMPPKDGILLDPFSGSGTTILAAKRLGFEAIGIEKSEEYCTIARARLVHLEKNEEPEQLPLFACC
jgi:DNA modification methylase